MLVSCQCVNKLSIVFILHCYYNNNRTGKDEKRKDERKGCVYVKKMLCEDDENILSF